MVDDCIVLDLDRWFVWVGWEFKELVIILLAVESDWEARVLLLMILALDSGEEIEEFFILLVTAETDWLIVLLLLLWEEAMCSVLDIADALLVRDIDEVTGTDDDVDEWVSEWLLEVLEYDSVLDDVDTLGILDNLVVLSVLGSAKWIKISFVLHKYIPTSCEFPYSVGSYFYYIHCTEVGVHSNIMRIKKFL